MSTLEKKKCVPVHMGAAGKTAYRPVEIAELTKRIIGGRSIVQFEKTSGISKSWLSKASNGKLPGRPSRKTLTKLWEHSEDPTVRLSDLLKAAGVHVEETDRKLVSSESMVATYIAGTSLEPLNIFMKAVRLGESGSFALQYERNKFVAEVVESKKRYVCFPAMCRGQKVDNRVVMADALLNIMDNEEKDKSIAKRTKTYVLTDEQEVADYFKKASLNLPEKVNVLMAKDYI